MFFCNVFIFKLIKKDFKKNALRLLFAPDSYIIPFHIWIFVFIYVSESFFVLLLNLLKIKDRIYNFF